MAVSKHWQRCASNDRLWHELSKSRWRLKRAKPRRFGSRCWLEAYGQLQSSMKVPCGYLTAGTQRVFGKSEARGSGLHAWLCLDHRSDCKLVDSALGKTVVCRLIIQNVLHPSIAVIPNQINLSIMLKDGRIISQAEPETMVSCTCTRIIALR